MKVNKKRIVQTVMISVVLSFCCITGLLNFISYAEGENMAFSNLLLTLGYYLAWCGAVCAARLAGYQLFLKFSRVWMILTMFFCLLFTAAGLMGLSPEGTWAALTAVFAVLFPAPAYGLFYLIGSPVWVMILAFVGALSVLFLPEGAAALRERRRLMASIK